MKDYRPSPVDAVNVGSGLIISKSDAFSSSLARVRDGLATLGMICGVGISRFMRSVCGSSSGFSRKGDVGRTTGEESRSWCNTCGSRGGLFRKEKEMGRPAGEESGCW